MPLILIVLILLIVMLWAMQSARSMQGGNKKFPQLSTTAGKKIRILLIMGLLASICAVVLLAKSDRGGYRSLVLPGILGLIVYGIFLSRNSRKHRPKNDK